MIKRNCLICSKEFTLQRNQVKVKRWGRYCSRICAGKVRRGDANPAKQPGVGLKISLVQKQMFLLGLRTWPKGEYSSNWKGGKSKLICYYCKKEFSDYLSNKRVEGVVFCSRECNWKYYKILFKGKNNPFWKGGKPICIDCRERCSYGSTRCKNCLTDYFLGENAPNWRGGITSLYDRIRACVQYKEWRNMIFLRDNYICQFCGKRDGTHNVDHIKPFAIILAENNIKTFEDALNCKELWDLSNGRTLCVDCHKQTPTYLKQTGQLIAV